MTEAVERPNVEYGDLNLAHDNEILHTVVGSGVHGIAIEGTDDHDEMAVFIEPVDHVIGVAERMDIVTYRTKPEGERSEPGDIDLSMYCHAPESRVLTTDLRWIPIVDIQVGQSLVAFDEGQPTPRRHRHFATGVVTAKQVRPMERCRVTTSEGETIVTPTHPFLVRRARNTKAEWVVAKDLRPGTPIYSVPTWTDDTSWEAGYLAGQFDGDGCLTFARTKEQTGTSQVVWAQKSGRPDVIYVENMLASRGFKSGTHITGACANVRVAGDWFDQARFLGSVRPQRLLRHQDLSRMWEARSLQVCGRAIVESVEPLDDGWMVAIETSTRTYIADGLLSHNSLRKYIRLAAVGNPTAVLPLWCPPESVIHSTETGDLLREHRSAFMSQQSVHRFLGYMYAQHERMMGRGRQNRVPNRPELIERYGWDVKYGAHALRLAYQGYEICLMGRLTLPLAEDPRAKVLAVKRGEVSQRDVSREILSLTKITRQVLANGTPLPEHPDWATIGAFSVQAHLEHWGMTTL